MSHAISASTLCFWLIEEYGRVVLGGSVTAQCLRSYGAGPDAYKGTAGIYLAFVY